MQRLLLFGLILTFPLFTACEDDADPSLLNYDGANVTAPLIAPGDYEMAARFTPNETSRYVGRFLEEVQVYFVDM